MVLLSWIGNDLQRVKTFRNGGRDQMLHLVSFAYHRLEEMVPIERIGVM